MPWLGRLSKGGNFVLQETKHKWYFFMSYQWAGKQVGSNCRASVSVSVALCCWNAFLQTGGFHRNLSPNAGCQGKPQVRDSGGHTLWELLTSPASRSSRHPWPVVTSLSGPPPSAWRSSQDTFPSESLLSSHSALIRMPALGPGPIRQSRAISLQNPQLYLQRSLFFQKKKK